MNFRSAAKACAACLIFACVLIPTLQAQPQTVTFNYTGTPLRIPGANTNVGAVADIFVPTAISVTKVEARVVADYPRVGDLEVTLISPEGDEVELLNNDCGSLVNINTTFAQDAQSAYEDFCPVEAGRGPFRPTGNLNDFNGELSAGYWSLFVINTESNSRNGVLREFSITITGNPVANPSFALDLVTNTASLDGGVVSPGQLVSIYGVALGPTPGVQSPSTPLPTTLGGTTVTFNGVPAPIISASGFRVDVQAPFSLTPGTFANVRVQTATGAGTLEVFVAQTFAGLFTNQSNGRGLAVVVNQNGTVNSAQNPASPGSYISLWATGLGKTTPVVAAGEAAPSNPLARVDTPIAVLIGGVPAQVTFAGLAPGLVGTYQVNAIVPSSLIPGSYRVLIVPQAGFPSQSRVTIEVR